MSMIEAIASISPANVNSSAAGESIFVNPRLEISSKDAGAVELKSSVESDVRQLPPDSSRPPLPVTFRPPDAPACQEHRLKQEP